jgi:putative ABC transport system permease protein
MTLAGFALSNIARRPVRTVLTVLGIALAVGTVVALLALGRGISDSISRGFDEHGAEFVVTSRKAADMMTGRLPEAMGADLAAIPNVAEVSGELYAFAVAGGGEHVLAGGWQPGAPVWSRAPLIAGSLPAAGERTVLLGDVVAKLLGASVGDRVELFDEEFRVAGIARYATAINRGLVAMPLPLLQAASLRPGQVSFFSVRFAPGLDAAAADEVKREIEARFPVFVSDTQEVLEGDQNVGILRAVSLAVSVVAFAMGALTLLSMLLISVQERTREIGMITAMGWSDGRVIALIVLEGLAIGLAGCVAGVAIGIAASRLFGMIPGIGGLIAFTPRLADLALPLALALPLCALGAAYPAWRAVRLQPAEALRRV